MNNSHCQYFTHCSRFGEEYTHFQQRGLWRGFRKLAKTPFMPFSIMHILHSIIYQCCFVIFYLCHWFSTKLSSLMLKSCLALCYLFMKPKSDLSTADRVCLQWLLIQLAWDNGLYVDIYFMTSKQMINLYFWNKLVGPMCGLQTVLKEMVYRDFKITIKVSRDQIWTFMSILFSLSNSRIIK